MKGVKRVDGVDRDTPIKEAIRNLRLGDAICLVRSGESFAGVFTLGHAAKAIAEGRIDAKVGELMDPVVAIEKDRTIGEAIRLMGNGFLVVSDGELVVLHRL